MFMLIFMGIVVACLSINPTLSFNYIIDNHTGCNNVFGAIPDANQSTAYITYLGIFDTTDECIDACINYSKKKDDQCQSYTYHTSQFGGIYGKHCYGRFGFQYGKVWLPINQSNINCGKIIYPCTSDIDCSLNGVCNRNTGNCSCLKAWNGYDCSNLTLTAATKGTGYDVPGYSSWGGTVLFNNVTNKYNMYVSAMDNHCGINSWTLNSRIILTENEDDDIFKTETTHGDNYKYKYNYNIENHVNRNSDIDTINNYNSNFNTKYREVKTIHQPFAHEPTAIIGPNGEHVIYYSSYNWTTQSNIDPMLNTSVECNCTGGNGSTTPDCYSKIPASQFIEYMIFTNSSQDSNSIGNNTFNYPATVLFGNRSNVYPIDNGDDTNLAGVILDNGTFIGMMRHFNSSYGSIMYLTVSNDWKNGEMYRLFDGKLLFPQLSSAGTEDPFVYRDCNGYFHAILHNKSPANQVQVCGAHAYSIDGVEWIYGGKAFDNNVLFDDGSKIEFSRRERPHFIMSSDDGCSIVGLTTGVQYGGTYGDATYTLLQPVKH